MKAGGKREPDEAAGSDSGTLACETRTPGRYMRRLADRLGLRDWTVVHALRDADEGSSAQCAIVYGRKHISVQLAPTYAAEPAEERRQTVVHELLHAHWSDANQVVTDTEELLGRAAYVAVANAYRHAVERAVDALADVIAPSPPLPEEGE